MLMFFVDVLSVALKLYRVLYNSRGRRRCTMPGRETTRWMRSDGHQKRLERLSKNGRGNLLRYCYFFILKCEVANCFRSIMGYGCGINAKIVNELMFRL